MKRLLVFQHVAHEPLGTLNPLLKSHGLSIRYVNFHREPNATPSLNGYDGLVVLGGPMNVDQVSQYPHLAHEVLMIREAIEKDLPVLGICLGAQLMAKALGVGVQKNLKPEIGWYDLHLTIAGRNDPLFAHFGAREKIFQWHEDAFALPDGAVHLASSDGCPMQAFRYGDKAYAFQFHLEVDEPMIHRWLKIHQIKSDTIIRETKEHIDRTHQLAHHCFNAFIKLFGVEKKFRLLSSR